MPVQATLTFRSETGPTAGRERIRLLEAVAREGSITAAAKSVGLTYKAAWDALDALANLFGQPLLETRQGGRSGGGARLTDAGQALVSSFHRLEAELERVLRTLEPGLSAAGLAPVDVLTGFLMRTSCRNVLRGVVSAVRADALSADVDIALSDSATLRSSITRESVVSLGLCPGRAVVVLIKASFVTISRPEPASRLDESNRLTGKVSRCTVDGELGEVALDIGGGKTITASTTADLVRALGLQAGVEACAVVDPSHVILAVD